MTVDVPALTDFPARLRAALEGLFAVEDTSTQLIATRDTRQEVVRFRGRFLVPPEQAYERVRPAFAKVGYTPVFRRDGEQDVVIADPGTIEANPGRAWINVVLLILTVISVLLVGTLNAVEYYELIPATMEDPVAIAGILARNLLMGLPYAVALMTILLCHEFGHYLVARRHRVAVSLPYFIPLPLPPLGTMGAAIVQKEPFRNRKVLFDVGIAGPLAGLVVAIPILLFGLSLSKITPIVPGTYLEGNSLLYLALKFLMFGKILPANGIDVYIHPIAFAGWVGLLVTSLNLLPAGQLDGGHVAYVLFGERTQTISTVVMLIALVLGLAPHVLALVGINVPGWDGWLLWAGLIYVLARSHPPALDEVTTLDPRRRALAWVMVVIFILVFIPIPFQIV